MQAVFTFLFMLHELFMKVMTKIGEFFYPEKDFYPLGKGTEESDLSRRCLAVS